MPIDCENDNSHYCDGASTVIRANSKGSLSIWCRPESRTLSALFSIASRSVGGHFFMFYVSGAGKVGAQQNSGGADFHYTTDNVIFAGGDLLHLAVVQNGSAPVIYVNGASVAITEGGSGGDLGGWLDNISTTDQFLAVGRMEGTSPTLYFDGIIYTVAYYPTNLSAAQMAAEYANGRVISRLGLRIATAGRYWAFDEGTGTNCKDLAAGYDLTLRNTVPWVSGAGTVAMPAQKRLMGVD